MTIRRDIPIEDLIRDVPDAAGYLLKHGIRCLACGEPIWGTLESAAREKGFTDSDIETFVSDLEKLCDSVGVSRSQFHNHE